MTSAVHAVKAAVVATPVFPDKNEFVVVHTKGSHGHSMKMTVGSPRLSQRSIFCLMHGDYTTFLRELGSHSLRDFFFYCRPTPLNKLGVFRGGKTSITLHINHEIYVSYFINSDELEVMF